MSTTEREMDELRRAAISRARAALELTIRNAPLDFIEGRSTNEAAMDLLEVAELTLEGSDG
jgi:hypothetical protein